ncbi:MAG TPA: hypothetical protein VKZ93_04365 [Arenibacter sp.]|nr:hypothetical protein [Arenibacter sp.]
MMTRGTFIRKTSAGIPALMIAPGVWSFVPKMEAKRSYKFRSYRPGRFLAPVRCVTPNNGFYIHTFYDVVPWSPDQKFLTVTKLPYQGRTPRWGDTAEVCIIDLENETIQSVYETKAWSFQLGANIQWGAKSNRYLYCNDLIDGKPVCVRIDMETGMAKAFSGAKYDISPDEKSIISPNLLTMNIHQYGYAAPDQVYGKPSTFTKGDILNEGLWQTDLETNKTKLLVGFKEFLEKVEGPEEDRSYYSNSIPYLFHSKFNRQNTRVLQVYRGLVNNKGRDASLFSMNVDGSNLKQCLTREHWNQKARFGGSGNHPNWHPDGEHVIMNCIPQWMGYKDMLFCQFKYDGSDFKVLSEMHMGSGHPSVNSDSTYLLADTYPKQKWVSSPKGEIPIRLLDLNSDEEQMICSVATNVGNDGKAYKKGATGSHYKLDPHPVWSYDYKKVCFNGAPEGKRQVFIADLDTIL